MGGEMLVAALAWPHSWVIRIGTLLASIGAGLQCLTGKVAFSIAAIQALQVI